jgi:hypothetical protein
LVNPIVSEVNMTNDTSYPESPLTPVDTFLLEGFDRATDEEDRRIFTRAILRRMQFQISELEKAFAKLTSPVSVTAAALRLELDSNQKPVPVGFVALIVVHSSALPVHWRKPGENAGIASFRIETTSVGMVPPDPDPVTFPVRVIVPMVPPDGP